MESVKRWHHTSSTAIVGYISNRKHEQSIKIPFITSDSLYQVKSKVRYGWSHDQTLRRYRYGTVQYSTVQVIITLLSHHFGHAISM